MAVFYTNPCLPWFRGITQHCASRSSGSTYQRGSTLMGDKTDKNTIAWLAQPEEHDYPAAQSYLN
ncbi:hypothetical protein GFB82_22195, partial [Acinetobacter baumannii]|nr:hypothetical protein [Acinetobacter baumannii]